MDSPGPGVRQAWVKRKANQGLGGEQSEWLKHCESKSTNGPLEPLPAPLCSPKLAHTVGPLPGIRFRPEAGQNHLGPAETPNMDSVPDGMPAQAPAFVSLSPMAQNKPFPRQGTNLVGRGACTCLTEPHLKAFCQAPLASGCWPRKDKTRGAQAPAPQFIDSVSSLSVLLCEVKKP